MSKHKAIAFFFSHGGLHLVVLLILIVLAVCLYIKVENSNTIVFRQMNVSISDTLKNHKISSLYLYKAMTPRANSLDTKNFADFFVSVEFQMMEQKIRNGNVNKQQLLYDSVHNKSTNIVAKIAIRTDQYGKEFLTDSTETVYTHDIRNGEIKDIRHFVFKSNKEVELYFSSLKKENISHIVDLHSYNLQNVLKYWDDDNPFYCFWIGITTDIPLDLEHSSKIEIQFNHIHSFLEQQPAIPDKVIPSPSEITPSSVIYKGKEKVESVLSNGGIFISGVDPVKKSKADKTELLYTVLIGTIITFSLDIFVQLIIKWRKLSK